MKSKFVLLLLLLLLLAATTQGDDPQIPPGERQWLREFYESTGGPTWREKGGWADAALAGWTAESVEPCPLQGPLDGVTGGWAGIQCRGQGNEPKPWNILVINLGRGAYSLIPKCSGNNLTGQLPSSFAGVPKLQNFQVSGPVPACVGNTAGTKCDPDQPDLCLPDIGQLGGILPSQLPGDQDGSVFAIFDTHVSGALPQFGSSSKLSVLLLNNNRLTGTVPWVSVPASLRQLHLDQNQLSGTLGEGLFRSSVLTDLNLQYTWIHGTLPELPVTFNDPQEPTTVNLDYNGITEFPDYLSTLTGLKHLTLAERNRTNAGPSSPIPPVFQRMSSLEELKLSAGGWTGSIPAGLGDLTRLGVLELFDNELTGSIPEKLCQLTEVTKLMLSNNKLTGSIPPCLSQLRRLEQLWLNSNFLSGPIPSTFSNFTEIFELPMNNNELSGMVPSALGSLTKLTDLVLNDNKLTIDGEAMDSWLSKLYSLRTISFNRNHEVRSLPATALKSLKKLVDFGCAHKGNHGNSMALNLQIPTSLKILDLSGNSFTGTPFVIPESWHQPAAGNASDRLEYLDLSDCGLRDGFDTAGGTSLFDSLKQSMDVLRLSNNYLTRVPSDLWRVSLRTLDLSDNEIDQDMTAVVKDIAPGRERSGSASTSLSSLEILDVSHNNIGGTFPQNVFASNWGLMRLSVLDVSSNQISGRFPPIFTTLPTYSIDASHNNLDGFLHDSLAMLAESLRVLDFRGNKGMKECQGADCAGQLVTTKGTSIVDSQNARCFQVAAKNLRSGVLRVDPSYSTASSCVCKDDFIGIDGDCSPCSGFTDGEVVVLDCRSRNDTDGTRLRDGFFPVWCSAQDTWSTVWQNQLNCTDRVHNKLERDSHIPIALVRCPVVARDHNPCQSEFSLNGFSDLKTWKHAEKDGCKKGYVGPACTECDTGGSPKYARELGSRICIECDAWSGWVPVLYLIGIVVFVVYLARKEMTPSNLFGSFVFYFQAITLIKRSVLPWQQSNWETQLSSTFNMNPSMSGCVWYMRIFLEKAEARFWFTMAVPLYVLVIFVIVYAVGRGYDCYYDSHNKPLVRSSAGAASGASAFSAPAGAQDGVTNSDSPDDVNTFSGRMTPAGGNYLQRTDSKMQPLLALDRAYKVLFALANLAYLPLCFQSIAGSHLASVDFDFIPEDAGLSGSYLLNAPTVIVPEAMFSSSFPWHEAERMTIGFVFGLVFYICGIPAAIYHGVYKQIRELDSIQQAKKQNLLDQQNRYDTWENLLDSMSAAKLRQTLAGLDFALIGHIRDLEKHPQKNPSRSMRIGGTYFCAFKHTHRSWPFIIMFRKVCFTFVIAIFPPNDPFLPVLVFFVLLIALLVQVAQRPMVGYLDNLLEEFTLVVLLVCFTLAQVVMADKNQSRSGKLEITWFTNIAKYVDVFVVMMFGLCIFLRFQLQRSLWFKECFKGDWGRRLTRILTIEEQEARLSAPGSVRRSALVRVPPVRLGQAPEVTDGSSPSDDTTVDDTLEEPLFGGGASAGESRPASPGGSE